MTIEVFEGLLRLFQEFDADPEVRVVVMKAEGKSFNAGLDLVEEGLPGPAGAAADPQTHPRRDAGAGDTTRTDGEGRMRHGVSVPASQHSGRDWGELGMQGDGQVGELAQLALRRTRIQLHHLEGGCGNHAIAERLTHQEASGRAHDWLKIGGLSDRYAALKRVDTGCSSGG